MKADHLEISIDRQELTLFSGDVALRTWPVSTAAKGAGFDEGSHRTPTGRFRIREKIGDGLPANTIFRSRQPAGTWDGLDAPADLILARILRLDGLDPENANSFDRFIYIHGTNHEDRLGEPCSCGCVRMSREAVIELHDMIEPGAGVIIHPPTLPRGRLIFFDCDSTLSSIEGIDELARAAGPEVFRTIEALTHAAMNGEVPLDEVFPRRMQSLAPSRELCERIAAQYVDTITPGAREWIEDLRSAGWTPVILSGGFEPLIRPLADELGIRHVEAVPLKFHDDGGYAGYGEDFPTTRNGGKPEIIRAWKAALLPETTVMVGDGISDLETKGTVDRFIGYGGVVERAAVRESSDIWITDFREMTSGRLHQLAGKSS